MNIGQHISTHTLARIFNAAAHQTSLTAAAADYKNSFQKLIDYVCRSLGIDRTNDVKANAKADVARAIQYAVNRSQTVPSRGGRLGYLESGSFSIKDHQGTALYFKLRQIRGNIHVIQFDPRQPHSEHVIYTVHHLTFQHIQQAGQSSYEELVF